MADAIVAANLTDQMNVMGVHTIWVLEKEINNEGGAGTREKGSALLERGSGVGQR